jgi:multiple sugar transport system substrate-binding protein
MKIWSSRFLVSLAVVVVVIVLSACRRAEAPVESSEPDAEGAAQSDVEFQEAPQITVSLVLNAFTPEADQFLEDQIVSWGEQNGVEITFLEGGFGPEQSPDCGMIGNRFLPELVLQDRLVEMTELVNRLNQLEGGFTEGALAAVNTQGKYWALPYASSTYVFYVRQDKLAEHGLPLPDTWEEAHVVAEVINNPDEFWGWGMQLGNTGDARTSFMAQLWAYGGSIWDEEGKPAIDSQATRDVLDFLRDAWNAGIVPPEAINWAEDSNNIAYQNGSVGMVLNAGSILRYLQANDQALLGKTAVILIPQGPAGRFVDGTFSQWGIFKSSQQVPLCFELTEWLLSPEHLRRYYEAAGGTFLPTYRNLLNDEMWQRPHLQAVAEMIPYTYAIGYPGPTTPWALEAMDNDFIVRMLQRVLVEGWDNGRAIAEADEALWQIYDAWQEQLE